MWASDMDSEWALPDGTQVDPGMCQHIMNLGGGGGQCGVLGSTEHLVVWRQGRVWTSPNPSPNPVTISFLELHNSQH